MTSVTVKRIGGPPTLTSVLLSGVIVASMPAATASVADAGDCIDEVAAGCIDVVVGAFVVDVAVLVEVSTCEQPTTAARAAVASAARTGIRLLRIMLWLFSSAEVVRVG